MPCWKILLSLRLFPAAFLVVIPLLTLLSAVLGITLSWVLERWMGSGLTNMRGRVIAATVVLLLIITLSRSLLAYIRQSILIRLNGIVNHTLYTGLIRTLAFDPLRKHAPADQLSVKKCLADIQKCQNAVSLFMATLLSDGALLVCMLGAVLYLFPLAALFNAAYLSGMVWMTHRRLPGLSFQHAHLAALAASLERRTAGGPEIPGANRACRFGHLAEAHNKYALFAAGIAGKISLGNLCDDIWGALMVIIILCSCLVKVRLQDMSYSTLLAVCFLTYMITALTPKIAGAFYTVAEGAASCRQLKKLFNLLNQP